MQVKNFKLLTFARIRTHFHSLQVLLSNWNIHHNVQHHHRLQHDTLPRPLLNGSDFDICLDMTILNRIVVASALDVRGIAMPVVCMMGIPRELQANAVNANDANLHMLTIPNNR